MAQAAVRATGAQSFAFIETGGAAWNDATAPGLVEYPLRENSAIVFTFGNDAESKRAKPLLDRIVAAMLAIGEEAAADRYASLASRLSDLQARLTDSKIADRVRGYLTDETNSDPTEAIVRHVETVLRPARSRVLLEQALSELEDEIEEREVVDKAKQLLRAVYSVSEEQAHIELRLRSRKSRTPLKEVAQQVIIKERHLPKGKTA
jgi:predicted Zn-dependent peptidase